MSQEAQVMIYEYGCTPPLEGTPRVEQQMVAAHRYYNTLTEIERRRRDRHQAALLVFPGYARASEQVANLETELANVRAGIQEARQEARRDLDTPDQDRRAKEIVAQLREARVEWKRERREATLAQKEPLAAIEEEIAAERRSARATCGCYWGTYLVVEAAADAARKSLAPPRFRHWDGSGHLAVQLQGGLLRADLHGCKDYRVQMVEPPAWSTRAERRKRMRTRLRVRVGSEGRAPVWAHFDVYLHRPLPADAKIKWVHVLREPLAPGARWKVQFTVETVRVRSPAASAPSRMAIDLGWRITERGLRVGYWVDDQDGAGEILLEDDLRAALTKADSLRAIRDRSLNGIRAELAAWRRDRALPGWLAEATKTLPHWRAASRFASLARRWGESRFEGDRDGHDILAAWVKQDRHLWTWEVNQRDKALRHRREVYRVEAARLAERYGGLVVERFDLRKLAQSATPEEEQDPNLAARHSRVVAAPSLLRLLLVAAFEARGRRVIWISATRTTQTCFWCRAAAKRTDALLQRCECGRSWDQDDNAARNLLRASAEVAPEGPEALAAPKRREGRWERAKAAKAEKQRAAT